MTPSPRVGKSVKNSIDTIFELEILAQKMRAKIRINVQKFAKNAKLCENKQHFFKMLKNTTKLCKNAQTCAKNCVQNRKISTDCFTSVSIFLHLWWGGWERGWGGMWWERGWDGMWWERGWELSSLKISLIPDLRSSPWRRVRMSTRRPTVKLCDWLVFNCKNMWLVHT